MAYPIKSQILIDDKDATSYTIKWIKNTTYSTNPVKNITIYAKKSLNEIINLTESDLMFKEVEITRGSTTATDTDIFFGVIIGFDIEGEFIIIKAADPLYKTSKKMVTYSFDLDIDTEAGVFSEIFKTLINDYTDLTADDTSVVNSGTENKISKFICKSESVYALCNKLADALGWTFYYSQDTKKVVFEPKGENISSEVIEFGNNVTNIPKWERNLDELCNFVIVQGAEQEVETKVIGQIGVTSGYTIESIQLAYIPLTVRVLCDSSNPPTTEKIIGVPSSTQNYDAYIDKTKKQIKWNTDNYTPNTNDYCEIYYTYVRPVPIQYENTESISTYGRQEQTLIKDNIKEVNDAEQIAKSYIEIRKDPILKTKLKVLNVDDIEIGKQIRVIDDRNEIDDYFYITSIKQKYPYENDEIEIVNVILDDTSISEAERIRRIKDLERKNKDDFESLVQVRSLSDDAIYEDRFLKLDKTYISGDALIFDNPTNGILDTNVFYDSSDTGFILGSSEYGILGTSTLGEGQRQTFTEVIAQDNERYIELFYDNEFEDTTNTTADWDTSNEQISFTSGEQVISEDIVKDIGNSNNTGILSVKFRITGTGLDNLTYYICEKDSTGAITYTEIDTTGTSTSRKSDTITLTNTNKYGVSYKITTASLFPTEFGTWGESLSSTITKLQINYELND